MVPLGNVASNHRTLLLIGPKRTGKSSTGNTILGRGQVFDTKGGGVGTWASATINRGLVTVVDTQGWGSWESVTREEKIELLRAFHLCDPGPHVVLLVIPLLDFTETERRVVETRMEILTPAIWRHTMVLFTCGDRLGGCSPGEHIRSGGPALRWLLEKCRYRFCVFDNKAAKQERRKEAVRGGKKEEGRKGKAERREEQREAQEQVRELLDKVEDMLQENGGWHFSLHMYRRMEEEWSRREQQLRARLEAETDAGSVGGKQTRAETKINTQPEREQRLEAEEEEDEGEEEVWEEEEEENCLRMEQENKEEFVERKIYRG